MRVALYAFATLALAMLCTPDAMRSALSASASSLFEATPFLFAGVLVSYLLRRSCRIFEYLGCGCGHGPSARSLPAAAATWILFGPWIATARFLAALLVTRILYPKFAPYSRADETHAHPLRELGAVLPAALVAGAALQVAAAFNPAHLSSAGSALLGAALGFAATPCGLGAVTLAGALRAQAPAAATAFLCVAGIVDLRALHGTHHREEREDALAYAMLALALGIATWRHGGGLVHPLFTSALGCCAVLALAHAYVRRRSRFAPARAAPALMLAGILIVAPPPHYDATETNMTDLFAGERLTFTGVLARDGPAISIVRYAITCCRADAAPVAVRLKGIVPYPRGTWLRVEGHVVAGAGDYRLVVERADRVAPPADPFLYR